MKILVVDDEKAILRGARLLLEALGHRPVTIDNPSLIVEAAVRERPDLIIHDLKMPGLQIESTVLALKSNPATSRTPIILFSASPNLKEWAQRLGVDGYLNKPFRKEDLLAMLESMARTVAVREAPR